jgi:hypothetical protein
MSKGTKYAGADWLKSSYEGIKLSPLGVKVADLLGQLVQGIYHISGRALKKVDWSNDQWIEIILPGHRFATFDFGGLTALVVLCHDACIRCEIRGCGWGYIRFWFSQRAGRSGELWHRHPTMEDAIKTVRDALLVDEIAFEKEQAVQR